MIPPPDISPFTFHASRSSDDTIAALSSPAGRSERAIVRLSGPAALGIAARLYAPADGRPLADLPGFSCADGGVLDLRLPCRLYLMRAPRSYTREDVVELHLPGSLLVAEAVLEAALAAGARLAGPGEFTRRAVEHGRIGPDQAAAVIALIRARSRAELAAAARGLSGAAGRELAAWRERAGELAAELEAELDYGEEPGGFIAEPAAERRLEELAAELRGLAGPPAEGSAAPADRGLVRIALAGPVNAGKSLLFRRLTGREALVSEEPGTTRDAIEAPLAAAPGDAAVIDTAGLGAPPGEVELLAAQAAERAWRSAALLVLVVDRSRPSAPEALAPALAAARQAEIPLALVLNKCDLPPAPGPAHGDALPGAPAPLTSAEVSALTGAGCAELAAALAGLVRGGSLDRSPAAALAAARRGEVLHGALEALGRARRALADGLGLACAADDLRGALEAVARHFEPGSGRARLDEAVLDRIFARFCVGK